jgi:hypothetical protein
MTNVNTSDDRPRQRADDDRGLDAAIRRTLAAQSRVDHIIDEGFVAPVPIVDEVVVRADEVAALAHDQADDDADDERDDEPNDDPDDADKGTLPT